MGPNSSTALLIRSRDRELLCDFLQARGWNVHAPEPDKFEEQGSGEISDLLILDTESYEILGESFRKLLSIKREMQICVVLLGQHESSKPWLDMGFDDSLRMPLSPSSLEAKLNLYARLIDQSKRTTEFNKHIWYSTFEAIDQAIMIVDRNFTIRFANSSQCLVLDTSQDELRGKKCWQAFEPHRSSAHDGCPLKTLLKSGKKQPESFDIKIEGRDYLVSCMPIFDSRGQLESVVHAAHDITEKKLAEERLQQADKMDALGRLAGGVAHDFNNLLMVIQAHAEMLSEKIDISDPMRADLDPIIQAAKRSAALTGQLLAFGRPSSRETKTTTEPNSCIRQMEPIFQTLRGNDVELEVKLQKPLPPICCDKTQLEQALMNLVVNAKDAMEQKGGKIAITTNMQEGIEGLAPMVKISVTDTGCGMDEKTASRILEPFFTTKAPGKGTGLGLSTVHKIVKQNKGQMNIITSQGEGTCFQLIFPIADKSTSRSPTSSEEPDTPTGAGTILLAEDDPGVLTIASSMLKGLGYDVIEAHDGKQALELFTKNQKIDLLLTDVAMPELNGVKLAKKLRKQQPDLPIVFMSGYMQNEIREMGLDVTKSSLLFKPLDRTSLARELASALSQRKYPTEAQGARPQVIIIDDDELIRKAFARTLKSSCEVTVTRTLAEFEQAVSSGAKPGVILCDLHLEETSPQELVSWFENRPQIRSRTIFITGGIFDEEEQNAVIRSGITLLQKPISRDELLRKVMETAEKVAK